MAEKRGVVLYAKGSYTQDFMVCHETQKNNFSETCREKMQFVRDRPCSDKHTPFGSVFHFTPKRFVADGTQGLFFVSKKETLKKLAHDPRLWKVPGDRVSVRTRHYEQHIMNANFVCRRNSKGAWCW